MKSEVIKGLRPGAFISHGIGDRHQAEALFIFQTMSKKTLSTATGTKLVRIPLLPIKWVRLSPDGSAAATLALIRLLNANLFNN
jgi:hypothetical protein